MEPLENAGFPECLTCKGGEMIPLSDYGPAGATIRYKVWICTNPECAFNIRIDKGNISINGRVNRQ